MLVSQRDPRWRDIHLVTCSRRTIGSDGCLLTCGASMLADAGIDTDPASLNRWMAQRNGYVAGCLVKFHRMGEQANLYCEVIDCRNVPAPVGRIGDTLNAGGYVLLHVDFNPFSTYIDQHWVRALRVVGDDVEILDPWLPDGGPVYMLPRYARANWDLARAIFRMALYTPITQGQKIKQRAYVQRL